MIKKITFVLLFFICIKTNAQNPIVPPGMYLSDPAAHVWNDGKLYVYGSRDESPDYYCSHGQDVISTGDLKTWTITKNIFAPGGNNSKLIFNNTFLYAPDVQYKNGLYYLYFCLSGGQNNEGVATSKNPLGPFENAAPINQHGYNEIDPCVFIDDDGQAYYIWGQFSAKVAKLKPDMTAIDSSSIRDSVVTEKQHHFHEGGYMIKRNGIYYFLYADMSRGDKPTCIGYSTSKSPFGPFTYRGVIIHNDHCDPGNWNNHGALVQFKNQWYVFYHRATQGSNTMRKACIEPIFFNKDGSIKEVEMTSQGAGKPLNAFEQIDAERACILYGNVRIQPFTSDNEELSKIKGGDIAGYKYINFNGGAQSMQCRIAPGAKACKIDVGLDNIWGSSIGVLDVPANKDEKWITVSTKITRPIKGIHAVWLRFSGEGEEICTVDWFRFAK